MRHIYFMLERLIQFFFVKLTQHRTTCRRYLCCIIKVLPLFIKVYIINLKLKALTFDLYNQCRKYPIVSKENAIKSTCSREYNNLPYI